MSEKKKKTVIVVAAAALFLLVAAGILAYFSDEEYSPNQFTVGYVETPPDEEFEPPSELTQGPNKYKKAVWVTNTGNDPAYVRVKLEFSDRSIAENSWISADGSNFYSAMPDGVASVPQNILENLSAEERANTSVSTGAYVNHLPNPAVLKRYIKDDKGEVASDQSLSASNDNTWVYIPESDDEELGGYYYYTGILDDRPLDMTLEEWKALPDFRARSAKLCDSIMTYFANQADVKPYDIYVYVEGVQIKDKDGKLFTETSGSDPAWKQAWTEFLSRKGSAAGGTP